jgi:hypothetical protein
MEKEPPVIAVLTRTLGEAEDAVVGLRRTIRWHWRTEKDKRIQIACADAVLVADFVDRCVSKEDVAELISTAVRENETYVGRFAEIHATVKDFSACLMAIDKAGVGGKDQTAPREKLVGDLTALADRLRQELAEAVDAFVAVVDSVTADDRRYAKERANAHRVANETLQQLKTRQLLQDAEDAREKLQEVTGAVSVGNLGAHYADYAGQETKSADRLRVGVAGLLAAITVYAFVFNTWFAEVSTYTTVLARLSATIPFAVLAAYLARESSKHRLHAKNARDLAMAMHTLPYYVQPLGADGVELRKALGMRVFGPTAAETEPQSEDGLFDDLPKALDTLEEVLRRIRETMERREGRQ